MKFLFAFVAVLAAFGASTTNASRIEIPNVGHGALAREIQDFLDMIPVDDVLNLAVLYLAEDAEVQAAVAYMQSPNFQQLAYEVETLQEVRNLMAYIYNAGIDIYKIVNLFNDFIGIGPVVPYAMPPVSTQATGGIRGFVDAVKALLPMDALNQLYEYKLQNSPVFADFIAQLKSPQFQYIVDTVYANPLLQDLLNKAEAAGIDLKAIKELLEVIFGIYVPPRPGHFFYRV